MASLPFDMYAINMPFKATAKMALPGWWLIFSPITVKEQILIVEMTMPGIYKACIAKVPPMGTHGSLPTSFEPCSLGNPCQLRTLQGNHC